MTAETRASTSYTESLQVEMSRFEIQVHSKLIGDTLLKLPDVLYKDCERFLRRTGDITLADALFRVFKKFKALNVNDRLSVVKSLVPASCPNAALYIVLSEIQERVEEWRESNLIT